MTWARFDDRYDDHPKVMAATHANPLAAALHSQAITASARRETDGLVDPYWLAAKAPDKRKRDGAVAVLLELRLFDLLPAGDAFAGVDSKGWTATLGPFDEDRLLVHDYLDYNGASAYHADRRAKDSARKAAGRRAESPLPPDGVPPESQRSPQLVRADSARNPDGVRSSRPGPSRPVPNQTPTPGARGVLAMTIEEVETVLRQCSRLHVDRVGLENAVGSWPGRDPVQAARTVVTWATDPAFRTTNAAKLLGDALSKQPPPATASNGGSPDLDKYDRAVGLA